MNLLFSHLSSIQKHPSTYLHPSQADFPLLKCGFYFLSLCFANPHFFQSLASFSKKLSLYNYTFQEFITSIVLAVLTYYVQSTVLDYFPDLLVLCYIYIL